MTTPGAADLAALLARHAPGARRFLAWEGGLHLPALLEAARPAAPEWVIGIEPSEALLRPLLRHLPPDPCLHLRAAPPFEAPPEGWGHPLLRPVLQGLRPDVVLLPGPTRAWAARAALRALPPGGLLLSAPLPPADAEALRPLFETLDQAGALVALRPRRSLAPPLPPRAEGSRAVIVMVVGEQVGAEWDITGPSVTAHAAAIGAALHVLRDGRGLPSASLKSLAADIAETHDRIIMMDADILVRPHAPDLFGIVPPGAVGAYPEGRHFARGDAAAIAASLHGVPAFDAQDYVNAGMLVLSRAHLGVLRALGRGTVGGRFPEQDTVNAAIRRLGAPLHRLGAEFNLIGTGSHLADWRCGWLLHTAGAPKAAYRRRALWQRQPLAEGAVWSEQPLLGRALRLPHMAAQAARLAGQDAHAIDPEEMEYAMPQAMPRLMPGGLAAIWLAAGAGEAPVATARIAGLAGGRWRIAPVPLPGAAAPRCRMRLHLPGDAAALDASDGDGGMLADLPDGGAAIELDLLPGPVEVALAGVLLTRVA